MKLSIVTIIMTIFIVTNTFKTALAQDTNRIHVDKDQHFSLGLGIPDSIDFHGSIGVGVGVFPDYVGSNNYHAVALPLIDIQQVDFLFLKGANVNPNDGLISLGWNMLNFSYSKESDQKLRASLGPLVRYSNGRDEDDSDILNGLGDIDGSVGLGGFFEFSAGPWSAHVTGVPQDAGDSKDGILVSFGAKYTAQISDKLFVSTGTSTSWVNDDYMQGFYGVTNSQSVKSGLARFDSKSGFKDVGINVQASYELSENWSFDGQVGYLRLLNDASDSPIVDNGGSVNQTRTLFGIFYHF